MQAGKGSEDDWTLFESSAVEVGSQCLVNPDQTCRVAGKVISRNRSVRVDIVVPRGSIGKDKVGEEAADVLDTQGDTIDDGRSGRSKAPDPPAS